MSLTAFYVGFGVNIGCDKLGKILLEHYLCKSQEKSQLESQEKSQLESQEQENGKLHEQINNETNGGNNDDISNSATDKGFFRSQALKKYFEAINKNSISSERMSKLRKKLEACSVLTDNDGDYNYDYVYYLEQFLKASPIQVSKDGLVLELIIYPHTHRDETNVAIGVFYEITDGYNSQYDLREHKKIINSNLDEDLFKNLFDKNPRYMIIPNGCNCCR